MHRSADGVCLRTDEVGDAVCVPSATRAIGPEQCTWPALRPADRSIRIAAIRRRSSQIKWVRLTGSPDRQRSKSAKKHSQHMSLRVGEDKERPDYDSDHH